MMPAHRHVRPFSDERFRKIEPTATPRDAIIHTVQFTARILVRVPAKADVYVILFKQRHECAPQGGAAIDPQLTIRGHMDEQESEPRLANGR